MTTKKKSFKKVGTNILQDRPQSMADFISDSQEHGHQKSKPDAQMHKAGSVHDPANLPDVRLHVFILGALERKLLDEVNRRKQDPTIDRKNANKRTVVEEALERFL